MNLLRSSLVVLVLSNLSNLFQYLSQLVLGRALTPEAFGIFNSINSLSVLGSSLTVFISYASAREYIALASAGRPPVHFVRQLFGKTLLAGALCTLLAAACSGWIARFLALQSARPVLTYVGILFAILVQAAFVGVLQGMSRYATMSAGQSLQMGARLAFVFILVVLLGGSYNAALAGVLLSYAVALAFYLRAVADVLFAPAPADPAPAWSARRLLAGSLPMALMWGYMGIVSNIDIPIVKHFLPEHEAGLYAAGAVLGRIAWFLPSMLVFVLFPEVVRSDAEGKSSVRYTLAIAALTCVLSFGLAAVFALFPTTFLGLLLGREYAAAGPVLAVVSFSMAIVAILSVLYNFCLAKRRVFFLLPAYAILAGCLALIQWRYHATSLEVARVFLAGLVLTLLVNSCQFTAAFWPELRRRLAGTPAQSAAIGRAG